MYIDKTNPSVDNIALEEIVGPTLRANQISKSRIVKYLTLIIIVAFSATTVHAQTFSSSPYSIYGVGLLKGRTSAYNRSLANTGIGINSSYYLNNLNPASYASIKPVTQIFETGFSFEADRYETTKENESSTTGNLSSINMWFRFSPKWGGTVGLAPYSTVSYNILSTQSFGTDDDIPVQFTGTGGLTQLYFGNGVQLTKNLSVGVTGSFVFGNITKAETILSGESQSISLSNSISARNVAVDFGAQYAIPLAKDRSLTLGAVYTPALRLNSNKKASIFQTNGDTLSIKEKEIDDYVLPSEIGAGISFQTPRVLLAFDATYKLWEQAKLNEADDLRNTLRFSTGFEYKGKTKPTTYWDIIALRFGGYVQDNYLNLGTHSFKEWGFTTGIGLPVNESKGTVGVSYHYNKAGTTNAKLILQQAHVVTIDITLRDFWFVRRKFD